MTDDPVSSSGDPAEKAREALAASLFAETSDTHYAMTMTDARDIAGRMLRGTRGKPLAVPYPQPGSELDPSRRWVEGRLSATPAGPAAALPREERGEGLRKAAFTQNPDVPWRDETLHYPDHEVATTPAPSGWWHPPTCVNKHNESGNCLDADGYITGWREEIIRG